jgi:signal transduction histidine kinase
VNLFALAGLILGTTCLMLTLLVVVYGKTSLHRVWALFNLAVAIWGFGAFFIGISDFPSTAIISWKVAHIGGIFIPVCFFHTICVFCEIHKRRMYFIKFAYIQGLFFLLLNFTDLFISKVRFVFDSVYYNQPIGLFYPFFFAIWISLVVWGHYELIVYFRQSSGIKRNQSIYFFIGMSVGFLGGITNFLPMFGIDIYPFGNFTIPIYCLISTYAILRYRLMDISLVFKKSMVYSLSAGILTSLFVVVVTVLTKYFSDLAGVTSYTIMLFSALLIAFLFNPLRIRIQDLIDRMFYKKTYDYYATIRMVSHDLATMFEPQKIYEFIAGTIHETLGLKKIYMLTAGPEGTYEVEYYMSNRKKIKESKDQVPNREQNKRIAKKSGITDFFKDSHDIIVKDELDRIAVQEGQDASRKIKKELKVFSGEVVVPVTVDGELSMVMVLGEKMSGDMFSNEDINLLNTISNQTSIALKNSTLYKDKVNTERMASIGMMAATFAHEIRNPLTSLKTFAQLMPEKYDDAEFREVFSKIVVKEIERINGLIVNLLDFSTEKKSSFVDEIDLKTFMDEIIEYTRGRLRIDHQNIIIEKLYNNDSIFVKGDSETLKQAFINIINNGCQAMHGEGVLKIGIKPNARNVEVAITDTGEGIDPENLSNIFNPFVTTKEMGVGLGLAISKRTVEEHNGEISVESALTEGTTFTVMLPM